MEETFLDVFFLEVKRVDIVEKDWTPLRLVSFAGREMRIGYRVESTTESILNGKMSVFIE